MPLHNGRRESLETPPAGGVSFYYARARLRFFAYKNETREAKLGIYVHHLKKLFTAAFSGIFRGSDALGTGDGSLKVENLEVVT